MGQMGSETIQRNAVTPLVLTPFVPFRAGPYTGPRARADVLDRKGPVAQDRRLAVLQVVERDVVVHASELHK